jgi:hypothetical protein
MEQLDLHLALSDLVGLVYKDLGRGEIIVVSWRKIVRYDQFELLLGLGQRVSVNPGYKKRDDEKI